MNQISFSEVSGHAEECMERVGKLLSGGDNNRDRGAPKFEFSEALMGTFRGLRRAIHPRQPEVMEYTNDIIDGC